MEDAKFKLLAAFVALFSVFADSTLFGDDSVH
jgi:hypothetical protein